jgi:hypothetical protein
MKTRLTKQLPKLTGDVKQDLSNVATACQALTDDLTTVIAGGLTMADGNLPFTLYKQSVISGRAFEVTGFGATVIASSTKVVGFSTKLLKTDLLRVTITLDGASTSDVILLVIGESAK